MRNTLWYLAGALLVTGCADAARPVDESGLAQAVTVSRVIPGHDLGSLGGPGAFSQAADINNAGVVVGVSHNRDGRSRAFRWTRNGGMKDLGTLDGGRQSGATRIVDNGQILGWSENAAGTRVPVRWNAAGRIEELRLPWLADTAYSHEVADFSQRGEVVGSATGDAMHGWYWSRATGMLDLRDQVPSCMENFAYAINAHGTVTGAACSGLGYPKAYTWDLERGYRFLDLGEFPESVAFGLAISDAGTVGGFIDIRLAGQSAPAIWPRGKGLVRLPNLPSRSPWGQVNGVNDRDIAVGYSADSNDAWQPVAWTNARTIVLLRTAERQGGAAAAINNRGQIVGWGATASGVTHAMLWAVER